jgi:diguanylate cyclase (GGDEF)-like protein
MWNWVENFRSADVSHRYSPWLMRRMLQEHFDGTKGAIFANFANMLILNFVFWGNYPPIEFLAADFCMMALLIWRYLVSKQLDTAKRDGEKLSSIFHRVEINAMLLGAWWGLSVMILMVEASPSQQVLCAIVASGTMAGSAHTYRTIKRAAYGFVIACSVGSAIAFLLIATLASYASALMLFCYAYILMTGVRTTEKNIIVRHQREAELRESGETINMLLADFTEQGSDWQIEMDAETHIINPSFQLAEAACRPIETLEGVKLFDLIEPGQERDQLEEYITNARSFRNHAVPLSIGMQKHWWSISARPVGNDNNRYRGIASDISAQRQAEEQVSYMAHFDALTGLPNRFQFNQRLSHTLQTANGQMGLMFLDLDQFKIINDTLGHAFGDLLLKGVARRLETCISGEEFVARLGGDEFAILTKIPQLSHISALSDRIIEAMKQPFRLDDHDVIVGTSIGIALAPLHGDDATTLLRNADLALYEAKAQGRNRYTVFETGMDEAAQLRRALELDLRGALGKHELVLHYQPLIRIDDAKTLGYEALIRWEHPERGVVMPNDFIPIAEESGMIIPIGEWVIRQAMDDLMEWPDDMTVSINLSPAQMRSPSLITTLIQALAKTGADPKRICLEITENVLMQDSEANLATLHKLRELGLEIALDDFGTGYSSLNYLRSFPFDKIKIDRCFISEIDEREDCQAIVRSVVNLANSLGMTTTAEGVEREGQMESLRREGCSNVQGYLFSKAVPQNQLSDLRKPTLSHAQKLVDLETERKKALENSTFSKPKKQAVS